MSLASKIRENPDMEIYQTDGIQTHPIPFTAMKGRIGQQGKTFVGWIDLDTGRIRVDCAEEPSFWLEISLGNCPFVAYAPDGERGWALINEMTSKPWKERNVKKARVSQYKKNSKGKMDDGWGEEEEEEEEEQEQEEEKEKREELMKITIQFLSHGTGVVEVPLTATVRMLKEAIHTRPMEERTNFGAHPDQQRLISQRVLLGDDGATLASLGVHNGSVVHLVMDY